MKNDSVNPARRDIVRIGLHVRDALDRELSADAQKALADLEPWYADGARARLDAPGGALAMELNTFFRMVATDLALVYGGGESGLSYCLKTVTRRLDGDAGADVEPLEQEFVDRALADAWRSAARKHGPDPKLWAELAREEAASRKLGYYESLDGFPSLDPEGDLAVPELACVDVGTIHSAGGEAYTQWVPLDDTDGALSLLPPGPSERPESPWRTVNSKTWAAGKLHPAPLSRAAVDKISESTVVLSP